MSPRTLQVIPILRIFSIEKAREFYFEYAGFHLDWEHRFEPTAPLYMQVSREGLVLHLVAGAAALAQVLPSWEEYKNQRARSETRV